MIEGGGAGDGSDCQEPVFPISGVPPQATAQNIPTENPPPPPEICARFSNMRCDWLLQALADGVGLPMAVQCVALPWQEEQCLRLMKEVESLTRTNR